MMPSADTDLPDGWTLVRVSEVCEVNPRKPAKDALPDDALVTFAPMSSVDERLGVIAEPEEHLFGDLRPKSYTAFAEGDVLLAKITPCFENGKAALAESLTNGLGFGSTEFHVFRSTGAILPKYLYHYVRQKSFRNLGRIRMTGTSGHLRVPAAFVRDYMLPLAPLAEQERAVAKVEELLEQVNAARARLARLPAILKRFRQSVLARACSGQLTVEWREEHGVELHGEDEDLPTSWERQRLADVCTAFQYGSSRKSDSSGEVPVLRMGNLQAGEIDWTDLKYSSDPQEIAKYTLTPNTVLFNRTNSPELVGKTSIYRGERPAIFAGYLIRIVEGPQLNPEFLSYSLNTQDFREYCMQVKTDGVSQSNINAKKLAGYELALPPFDEQAEIVRRVSALFALADGIEAHVRDATFQAEQLSQAILARAFRGELVPTEAELAAKEGREYEPASVLLARIQDERGQREPPKRTRSGDSARRRTSMKKIDKARVQEVIAAIPQAAFSFDDLRATITGDYDALKDVLFSLLDDPESGVIQVFDEEAHAMRFQRKAKP